MQLVNRRGGEPPRAPVTVELDDIQATVLRYRPEPYYGTHVMLHVEDAQAGREFVRRLTPHIDSAAEWWKAADQSGDLIIISRQKQRVSTTGNGPTWTYMVPRGPEHLLRPLCGRFHRWHRLHRATADADDSCSDVVILMLE
jgi:deferrochelatase/peroxidase EfeB